MTDARRRMFFGHCSGAPAPAVFVDAAEWRAAGSPSRGSRLVFPAFGESPPFAVDVAQATKQGARVRLDLDLAADDDARARRLRSAPTFVDILELVEHEDPPRAA